MLKNSDSENDTEAGHMHSGRVFIGFHLENLFKENYREEGFYSGEEVDLTDEEHSETARTEEGEAEEPFRDEHETSGTIKLLK
jgi:hypothetical protein